MRAALAPTSVLLIVILGLPVAGAAQTRSAIAEGRRLLDAGQAAEAIALLEPARASWTDAETRPEALRVLGLAYMLAGRPADAVPCLEAAIAVQPLPDVAHVLAQAAAQIREVDKLRAALAVAFGLPAGSAHARVAAGQLLARLDMHELAEAELRAAIAADPTVPHAHYLLGQEALFRGRLDEAAALTRRELSRTPLDAMALSQLGDVLTRQARWDEAAVVLQQSIWVNPYYSAPYILLARGYLQTGQVDLAEAMASRAIAFDPNNRAAHYLHGQILKRLGRPEAAKAAFARAEALQQEPGRR